MEVKRNYLKLSIVLAVICFGHLTGCRDQKTAKEANQELKLFSLLTPEQTGVSFENTITRSNELNIFIYQDFIPVQVQE